MLQRVLQKFWLGIYHELVTEL